MNGVMRYQQSIASEFSSIKDRVRFFINDRHWGEDGRYKEIILINYLRRILPNNVSVGTGFVKNKTDELTGQIDIIVYKSSTPRLFSEGDFVILMPESILGIIEVKSRSTHSVLADTRGGPSVIQKAEENGRIIGNTNIFNGIFAYDNSIKFNKRFISSNLANQLRNAKGYLNHISLGSNNFLRYWSGGNPSGDERKSYSAYNLSYSNVTGIEDNEKPGFAFGYFISNLLEAVYAQIAPKTLDRQYFKFLYPLKHTKERYRVEICELYLEN